MPEQNEHPNIATIPPMDCPYCGKSLGAVLTPDGSPVQPPETGTFMVCVDCKRVAVYVAGPLGGGLRVATPEEQAQFTAENPDMISRVEHIDLSGTDQ